MSYGTQTKEPLRNTVRVGSDRDFDTCPAGQKALALVRIKNTKIKDDYGEREGFMWVFRDRESGAFANIKTSSTFSARSNFGKLIVSMSGGKAKIEDFKTEDEIFNHAQRYLDHWFLGTVEHSEWKAPDGADVIFVNIQNKLVVPHPQDKDWGNASEYFKKGSAKKSVGTEPLGNIESGFESMPNMKTFGYALKLGAPGPGRAKQEKFIEDNGGHYREDTGFFHFPKEIEAIKQHFKGEFASAASSEPSDPMAGPVSFEQADIPF